MYKFTNVRPPLNLPKGETPSLGRVRGGVSIRQLVNSSIYILLLLSITFSIPICAQEPFTPERSVSTQIAIGHLNQLDTYLSNEKYYGTEWRFVSEVVRDSPKHPLTYTLTHEGTFANTHNRADNANELSGHYDFAYSLMRKWTAIRAGMFANADIGFCYNTRTSANNPAQGYASLNIGPQVMAHCDFRLFNLPLRLTYQARIPLIGIMFSPNYGQSYYEIFNEGNHDHNIVLTSLATFQLRHQLSLDIPVAEHTSMRIGYLGDIRQATPNNLKQHQWYNAVIIGVTIKK